MLLIVYELLGMTYQHHGEEFIKTIRTERNPFCAASDLGAYQVTITKRRIMLLVALALAFLVATSTARPNDEYRSAGADDENGLSPEFRRFVEKFPDIKLDRITMSPERIVIT